MNIELVRPWLLLILVPALIMGIVPFMRLHKKRRMSSKHLIPFIIHLCLVFVLASLLSGVKMTETDEAPLDTSVVFVVDISESNQRMEEDMNRFINDIIDESDLDHTKFGMVLFGNGVLRKVNIGDLDTSKKDHIEIKEEDDKTQTNIQSAIEEAAAMFTEVKVNKKIVVLSDGNQTIGNGFAASKRLAEDILLDAAYFNMTAEGTKHKEVQLISLSTSGKIEADGEVTFDVVVKSTSYVKSAKLTFYYDGESSKSEFVTLEKGSNSFSFTYTPTVVGVNTVRAEISVDGDLVEQNNQLYSWYSLDPKGSILIVEGSVDQYALLEENGIRLSQYDVEKISPTQFPKTLEEMLKYDEIILMNTDFAHMPTNAGANLKRYVQEVGRGLLVTGGDNVYSYAHDKYRESPIADILPVHMDVNSEKQTTAIVFVVDLSSSMREKKIGDMPRYDVMLDSLKKALRLDSIQDDTYVAVVAFDQDAEVVIDISGKDSYIGSDRDAFCNKVEYALNHYFYAYYLDEDGNETDIKINIGLDGKGDDNLYIQQGYQFPEDFSESDPKDSQGYTVRTYGTSYKWAIQKASDMLSKKSSEMRLDIKQVVLMSDGAPNDSGSGYDGIVKRMAKAGITTSTIAIGVADDDDGKKCIAELEGLSADGKGSFFNAKSAEDLTNELIRKAEEMEPEIYNEREVQPYLLDTNASIMQGVRSECDKLGGYYATTIKEEANLVIYVDQMKPIYAEWTTGLGKVAVFMSDLGNKKWVGGLLNDEDGLANARLVSNILVAPLNKQVQSTGLDVSSERKEEVTTITVVLPHVLRDNEELIPIVTGPDGVIYEGNIAFEKVASTKYRGALDTPDTTGTYVINLVLREFNINKKPDELLLYDRTSFAVVGYYNDEYNVFDQSGKDVLHGMASNGNGSIITNIDTFYDNINTDIRIYTYDPANYLPIIAIVLFILDIVFRSIVIKRKKEKDEMTDEEQILSMKGR